MSKLETVIARLRALPEDEAEALAHEIDAMLSDASPGDASATPAAYAWQREEIRRRQTEPLDLAPEDEMDAFFARMRP